MELCLYSPLYSFQGVHRDNVIFLHASLNISFRWLHWGQYFVMTDAGWYELSSGTYLGLAYIGQRGLRGKHCRLTVGALSMLIATIHWECLVVWGLNIIMWYTRWNCIVLVNFYLTWIVDYSVICTWRPLQIIFLYNINIMIIISIQPLGQFRQEPLPSQATGMALAHCILGKFLGVACHCFPLILIYVQNIMSFTNHGSFIQLWSGF
jgi:hypothetical protein